MNIFNKTTYKQLIVAALCLPLASCVSEDPFSSKGEGTLMLSPEIRSEVTTRSSELTQNTDLREKLVIYIETSRGVIKKIKGLDNLPPFIPLKSGRYLAEAWTGDSVSASFDKKWYRAKEEFVIADGENKNLPLVCKIANVVVSVKPDVLGLGMSNLKVTFSHSRGSLEFTEENIAVAKGYFMMPNADKHLSYKMEGDKSDGTHVVKEGIIPNVQRAHEYVLNITSEPGENTLGGALIKIRIEDIPLIEETVEIFGRPTIEGVDFNIDEQVVGIPGTPAGQKGAFTDKIVYVRGYEGIYSLQLRGGQNFIDMGHIAANYNLIDPSLSADDVALLANHGITWDNPNDITDPVTGKRMSEMRITFHKSFFDHLPQKDTEYRMEIIALDNQEPMAKNQTKVLRIATSDAAVEVKAPVETAPAPDPENAPMAVLSRSATLTGYVMTEGATNYGIKYRKQGETAWTKVPVQAGTRAPLSTFKVDVNGLQPSTTYEYTAYSEGYDKEDIQTFTTEGEFTIPNASFEDWSSYSASTLFGSKNVVLPWSVGDKEASFWGSGNEGSATANKTLTNKSTDMFKSGQYSARLGSDQALGIIAAGNIFVGKYVETEGTNGHLLIGRSYNGSHPTKLKVWANYRPGTVDIVKNGMDKYLPEGFKGSSDHGQIYVALTTSPIDIRTSDPENGLFNKDAQEVLAYGQVTWTAPFGADGVLETVEIPIEYYERAKTMAAKYLVIVVSASKYGDYFSGSSSSVMYLDDFELIYDK